MPNQQDPPACTLYLPVETAARELDGKLLLALFAIQAGLCVVIGNRAIMNEQIHRFDPGIYLSHNFDRGRRRILSMVKALGHTVVAWDEEGLVWISPDVYLHRRVNPDCLKLIDQIYAWGDGHADVLEAASKTLPTKILRTGNPRSDLLQPAFSGLYQTRVRKLRAELGNFILINSNFGWLNYALATSTEIERTDNDLKAVAGRARHPLGYIKHRYAIFRALCDVLPALSARFPDRRIVIRPHPSEHPRAWQSATRGLGNVSVRYDDHPISWLIAAGSIVHNGCTTAVEAAMLGRSPIMFMPKEGGEYEILQPLAVSRQARSHDELFRLIEETDNTKQLTGENDASIRKIVADWQLGFSAQRIASHIANLAPADMAAAGRVNRYVAKLRSRGRYVEKLASRLNGSSPSRRDYIDYKFPSITAAEFSQRAATLAGLTDLPVPRILNLSDRMFRLEPENTRAVGSSAALV